MKMIFLFFLFVIFPILSNGQKLIYVNLDSLNSGIYKDFEEFKYNSPSIPFSYDDYQVIEKQRGYGLFNSDGFVKYFKIKLSKENSNIVIKAFGFCDGKHVFLNTSSFGINLKAEFLQIEYLGLYSYFESISNTSKVTTTNDEPYSPMSNIRTLEPQILSIIDGKVISLNKSNLRRLIESDYELSAAFENESYKNAMLKDYIIKYSEKHKNDYKPPLTIAIDKLIYKLDSDSTYMDYYRRILGYSSNTTIQNVELRKDYFANDTLNFIGLKAKHINGTNQDYFYKIGTWRFFYKNGQLKELINYDLWERKNGLYQSYDEQGNLVEEKNYFENNLIQ